MNYGILIACYVLVGQQYAWVNGREIGEKGDSILFAANGRQAEYVNDNNCKYLEDPVQGYSRMLKVLERNKNSMDELQKKIDKISTGNRPWCLVEPDYGRRTCTYDTWEQCRKAIKVRGEDCQERKLSL
jgi:hypothetical protein